MSKHLNYEILPHQTEAVEAVINVFEGSSIQKRNFFHSNNVIINDRDIINQNIDEIRKNKNLVSLKSNENFIKNIPLILDIHMETGTGKTYTYVKTIFELNKEKGISKFIIVVPTLSIKAGTVNFLKSESSKIHFRDIYKKTINCLAVNSKENTKNKKKSFPYSIGEFIRSDSLDESQIQVLVINQGMINSKTIQEDKYDITFFDKYSDCVSGIASITPVVIIDEPHKFKSDRITWNNILNFKPQFIIRYGATFDNYFYNLIHSLDSIKAFNEDLVKGISVHITESENGKNEKITLKNSNSSEAEFVYLNEQGKSKTFIVPKGGSFPHSELQGITLEESKSRSILLSNGLVMKPTDSINPFSYAEVLQNQMMRKAIEKHLELEEEYMKNSYPRIKPMTLFFIDSISSYRNEDKSQEKLRILFEEILSNLIKNKLETLKEGEYKEYLKLSLKNIGECHGGYFSKDNSDSDDKVEREIYEILHDKETLLDINNIRRFIFSKWTLREGWDNPNVFVICKLRGSGSETNKLQEVGRGLRIPVNEFMNRVTDKEHYLHYFVDFEERNFTEKLKMQINGGRIVREDIKNLEDDLLSKISELYNIPEDDLFDKLREEKIITRKGVFIEDGYNKLTEKYSLAFESLKENKIINAKQKEKKVNIRVKKYENFKKLWEELNNKVIIKYNFKNNIEFQNILNKMIETMEFSDSGISITTHVSKKEMDEIIFISEKSIKSEVVNITNLSYKDFLIELEKITYVPLNMLHLMFIHLYNKKNIDINKYLNMVTVRKIHKNYIKFLILNSENHFKVNYDRINTIIHPTALTDKDGNLLKTISSNSLGIKYSNERVAENYLYEELFFDSDIEKANIKEEIKEVVVFAKIPKNSIKIPIIGGGTYSPDFAYIVKYENNEEVLNLIIESKGKDFINDEEKMKISNAEIMYKKVFEKNIKIKFKKQLKTDKVEEIIKKILENKE